MDPREIHQLIIPEIQEALLFIAANYRVDEIGGVFDKLSECFQALAICHLLETGDIDQFRENLVRSGHARRYFLRKSREEGNTRDHHLALSRTEAFLDSVAAGYIELAKEITELSVQQWEPDWEYEDDYCFFQILHNIIRNPEERHEARFDEAVGRFEKSLEGGSSPRLDVCKALLLDNQDGFIVALNELIEEKQDLDDQQRSSKVEADLSDFTFWPRSFVSIEGLALLKITELVGFQIDDDFPLCPRIARLSTADQDYRDMFQEIEHARDQL
jgi:hypothetical protein